MSSDDDSSYDENLSSTDVESEIEIPERDEEIITQSAKAKTEGNEAFSQKQYDLAIRHYDQGLDVRRLP